MGGCLLAMVMNAIALESRPMMAIRCTQVQVTLMAVRFMIVALAMGLEIDRHRGNREAPRTLCEDRKDREDDGKRSSHGWPV